MAAGGALKSAADRRNIRRTTMTTEADDVATAIERLAVLLTEVQLDHDEREGINAGQSTKHRYEEMLATIQGAIDERIAAAFVKRGHHD
jgi:flagellar motility protein MotE (MotC chaperone)